MKTYREEKITWPNFKKIMNDSSNESSNVVYRGHASSEWTLQFTLSRFLGFSLEYPAREYFSVLEKVFSEVVHHDEFKEFSFFSEDPFKTGMFCADKEHQINFKFFFNFMTMLRHLGFPTPILDWTKDPFIAVFFAFSNGRVEHPAVFQLEGMQETSKFAPFEKNSNFMTLMIPELMQGIVSSNQFTL